MKRPILIMLALILTMPALLAQERRITGTLVDSDTREPVIQTTVQLLTADSTFVVGALSDSKGSFALQAPANGKYLLRLSSIGYHTQVQPVNVSQDKNVAMGRLAMRADAVLLSETTVTGQAMKVVVRKDTFIYNAAAYRTPEGSVAEELVKRIPGAQVDDDGKITINGKEVKKILVDGKEFMVGDTKTAMKNLPTYAIEKIRAYDEKSDLSRVTGIDDGNEETVLDFGLKRGMNKGMISNIDLAAGTKDRYAERLMAAYFKDGLRIMAFGNANNTNDMGFGGRGGWFGRGRDGLNASKMAGVNLNYEKKDTLRINGSVRWNHTGSDVGTKTSSENFVSRAGSFNNSISQRYGRSNSWNANMRIEWTPDTLTNIMFRPRLSYTETDGRSWSQSASFSADPYLYVIDPLSTESLGSMAADSLVVNRRDGGSISYGENKRVGGVLQLNRRLGNRGRNVTLRADANYNESKNNSFSTSNIHLYRVRNRAGTDSTYQTNRYNLTPSKNWSYSLQGTYSEPLWRATFLQLSYKFNYSYSKIDRATYDFSSLGELFFAGLSPTYRGWDSYLGRLEKPYQAYLDSNLSRYSEYKNYTHDLELTFRMIRSGYDLNAGVLLQPQRSCFIQRYQGTDVDTVRTVTNITPTLDFRYQFSDVGNLRVNYRGYTSQPGITDLLDITDDSDPLNISRGNPGLKPSFTNHFRLSYNNYIPSHQQGIMAYVNYATTRNSISRKVTYNEVTGGRTTRPENINGDWSINGALMYNRSIDTTGVWNINTWTHLSYNNRVGYLSVGRKADSQKNTTRTLSLNERMAFSYRNEWLEVELDGAVNYDHTRNQLQRTANLDTWRFVYGVSVNLTAPWGTSLSTDLHQNSRRGYNDQSMNTNELVWNAQLSQSFLRQRSLTLSLQFNDILANQSNFSRTVNAMQRSDTEYNSINSYAMLHVIYRLNLFGGRQAGRQVRGRDAGDFDRRFGPRGYHDGGHGFGGRRQ